jgi:hypothetical protein
MTQTELIEEVENFITCFKKLSVEFKLRYPDFRNQYNQILVKGLILNAMSKWERLIRELVKIEINKGSSIQTSKSHYPFTWNYKGIVPFLKIDSGTIPYIALCRIDNFFDTKFSLTAKKDCLDKLYELRNRFSHGDDFVLEKEKFDDFLLKYEELIYNFL